VEDNARDDFTLIGCYEMQLQLLLLMMKVGKGGSHFSEILDWL
jgi:hypothetical protein